VKKGKWLLVALRHGSLFSFWTDYFFFDEVVNIIPNYERVYCVRTHGLYRNTIVGIYGRQGKYPKKIEMQADELGPQVIEHIFRDTGINTISTRDFGRRPKKPTVSPVVKEKIKEKPFIRYNGVPNSAYYSYPGDKRTRSQIDKDIENSYTFF